jgi:hypothetical protein
MLGAAKHPLYLFEDKQKQIPRFARDDIAGDLLHQPARLDI